MRADRGFVVQCENCERRSHVLHDPKHAFFKIPRPLDKQIESAVALLPLLYVLCRFSLSSGS